MSINNNQWGTPAPSPAPAQQPAANSNPPAKRTNPVLVALVAIIALAIAAGGGAWWFTQNNNAPASINAADATSSAAASSADGASAAVTDPAKSESPATEVATVTAQAEPKRGSCNPQLIDPNLNNPVNLFCDGEWFSLGQYSTANITLYYWTGDRWAEYSSDGTHFTGFECYDRDKLVAANAPKELLSIMDGKGQFCTSEAAPNNQSKTASESTASIGSGDWLPVPACDGSYVVIVESVLVYPGKDAQGLVNSALAKHPGAKATYPGACASFRARVEGADVYPIYYEYGNDLSSACAAARSGGNARALKNSADYSSPC
ncbi:MAG: hypothetical protein SOW59_03675 [Corynebacterium sp.]|nr:hypothetical protein [Corynebacterium sp.]